MSDKSHESNGKKKTRKELIEEFQKEVGERVSKVIELLDEYQQKTAGGEMILKDKNGRVQVWRAEFQFVGFAKQEPKSNIIIPR